MSIRTQVELNHDFCCPRESDEELLKWAKAMMQYLRGGRIEDLPKGVTFIASFHHSDPRAA